MSRFFVSMTESVCRALLLVLVLTAASESRPGLGEEAQPAHLETDLLIVGGTESGCAAAVQAARMGVKSIVLVNDTDWLGGQFTSEALGAIDENRARSGTNEVPFPRSGLFCELTDRIKADNRRMFGHPRPGNTVVAMTCRAATTEKLFRGLLQPFVDAGQLQIISNFAPAGAELSDDRRVLRAVRFEPVERNKPALLVNAKLTIDASDWGDAIQAAGAEFEFGPDLQEKYGEPSAPTNREAYPITEMNPITWCLVIVESDQEQPIPRPQGYDDRKYWLSTAATFDDHEKLGWTHKPFFRPPPPEQLYRARRLVDRHFPGVKADRDVILLNWPTQNYPLDHLPQHVVDALEKDEAGASRKNIVQMTRRQRQIIFDDAKQHALGFLYHLQTTVHDRMSPEQRRFSFRRFELSDEFGTPDRLPPKPYIRESLRLLAMHMMREQDTLRTEKRDQFARVMYEDGVGAWQFEYDFHPTGRAFHPQFGASGPWEAVGKKGRGWGPYSDRAVFPLRSLIPRRVDGLLGAQKNLGYSSLVSAAVRLHDQSMMVGQAAGAAAAVSLRHQVLPRAMPFSPDLLREIRAGLCSRNQQAIPVALWPFRDLPPEHAAFEAINLLAACGLQPLRREEVDFRPDDSATSEWMKAVVEQTRRRLANPAALNEANLLKNPAWTRAAFAKAWWELIRELPLQAVARKTPDDADGDGIGDVDDPLPLNPQRTSWPN